jgi:hypothetical protein
MSEHDQPEEVRERGETRARTFVQAEPTGFEVDPDNIQAGYRVLYAVFGLGGVAAQLFVSGGPVVRGVMGLGSFALLYMAIVGRAPGWWGK